ncbi:porin family protein [Hymenobacter persicinus]|uniref:PorT family protein n=1 Tax=Hymenobacter persicinus TaxID=2025506 RepID=A0A4Q5LJH5_9BACT|nr:porin family protein [Hymenobacter persicinus]RYU83806.1 PorT family protein [Hymenobacter persicinus]
MKKIYLTLAACVCATGLAQAQNTVQVGVRAGANWANNDATRKQYYTREESAPHPQLGFMGGIFATYQLTSWLSVQPELLYSRQGTAFSGFYGGGGGGSSIFYALDKHRIKLDYLELPVLVQAGGKRLFGELGMQAGFLVGTRDEVTTYRGSSPYSYTEYSPESFERWQCNAVAGLGVKLPHSLALTVRYSYGLRHVLKQLTEEQYNSYIPARRYTDKEMGHNQVIQASVSYILPFGNE